MTLYTTMPLEVVLDGLHQEREADLEVEINGILMQVAPVDASSARIVRLLRCSLNDYLDPAYAPGQMIHYKPALMTERK